MSTDEKSPFDKFLDDICEREETARSRAKILSEQTVDTPQRRLRTLYQERPQNRIRWVK